MQLPTVEPFDLREGGRIYRFTDTRLDPVLAQLAGQLLIDFVHTIPPRDLLCSSTAVQAEDRRLARERAWDATGNSYDADSQPLFDQAVLEAELEKARRLNEVRHTVAIFDGDVKPLVFAMQINGELVGAWQWYAIKIVSAERRANRVNVDDDQRLDDRRQAPRLKIRAGWFPALANVTRRQLANRSIDLVTKFVERDRMMRLADGRFLDLVQATAPTIEVGNRPETRLLQFARERLERNRDQAELKLTSRDDPTQADRKRVRVTAVDVDPLDEPEIDELERDRTGGQ